MLSVVRENNKFEIVIGEYILEKFETEREAMVTKQQLLLMKENADEGIRELFYNIVYAAQ